MGFDRVYPVYYEISFELETENDLIINWIYPIKTHSRETWGKSTTVVKTESRSFSSAEIQYFSTVKIRGVIITREYL
jgi:hypothetical protein